MWNIKQTRIQIGKLLILAFFTGSVTFAQRPDHGASVSVQQRGDLLNLNIRLWNPLKSPVAVQMCGTHQPLVVCTYNIKFEQMTGKSWTRVESGLLLGDTGPKGIRVYPPRAYSRETVSIRPGLWAFDYKRKVRLVIVGSSGSGDGHKPVELASAPFMLPPPKR
jgi:hypothetical protein